MVDNDFYFRAENISCCSLELLWKDKNREENANNSYEYKLYKNDNKIYQGKNTSFEVIDLNPNETYIFKIKIMKSEKQTDVKAIHVTALKAPISLISENSIKVANGENIKYNNELSEIQKNIIKNCSKLIFDENEKNLIKGNFVSNILKRAAPGGLTDMIVVMLMVILGHIFNVSQVEVSTSCTFLLMVVGMMMVARASKPIDRYKIGVIVLCILGLVLSYALIPRFFGMERMGLQSWVICIALALFSVVVLRWMTRLIEWTWKQFDKSRFIQRLRA